MNTKNVVRISIIAALYTVLTVALAPLSYGPLQFRIAEFLKVFVLYNPWLSIGIGIGTFFANLSSPYVGPLELIWMPLTDIAGGILAWIIFRALNNRHPVIPMTVYAITTALAVGVMLYFLGVGGTILVALAIFVSEIIIFIGGIPIVTYISRWVDLD
jgi:uncharacterized membrane protein